MDERLLRILATALPSECRDDLIQVGRIALWQLGQKHPDASSGIRVCCVRKAMLKWWQRESHLIRIPSWVWEDQKAANVTKVVSNEIPEQAWSGGISGVTSRVSVDQEFDAEPPTGEPLEEAMRVLEEQLPELSQLHGLSYSQMRLVRAWLNVRVRRIQLDFCRGRGRRKP